MINFLSDYEKKIEQTDKLGEDAYDLITFGLFGEVGSVLAVSKKAKRDEESFDRDQSLVEELGDVLWYFARLCNRKGFSINTVVAPSIMGKSYQIAPTSIVNHPLALIPASADIDLVAASKELGRNAALVMCSDKDSVSLELLSGFFISYITLMSVSDICFSSVVDFNLNKTLSRFSSLESMSLPEFDLDEHEDEQLPRRFQIEISQRPNGKTYMKMNGVFLGDPLTDNIKVGDGYRFHDVFHMAYAAILHWSPVFRALLKHKRKSNPGVDETQDSGRAIVIEEGLSAWIFSIAKERNYFEGHEKISFDVLKTVKQFVKGYEVEACPYKLFEKAILDGYNVFREVKKFKRGVIVGDRDARTLTFTPATVMS